MIVSFLAIADVVVLILNPGVVMGTADPVISGGSSLGGSVGSTVPTITGVDFSENSVSIDPKQQPMVIVFVAHWCKYCKADLAELGKAKLSGSFSLPVPLVAVSTRHLPYVNWPPPKALDLNDAPDEVLVDTNSSLARYFGVSNVPQWYFTDSKGVIRVAVTGTLTPEEVVSNSAEAVKAGG